MKMNKKEKAGIAGVVVLLLAAIVGQPVMYHASATGVTITVTDKERIVTSSGQSTSSKYLIFTSSEVFQNVDVLTYAKWDSSDIQGKLQKGKTYNVKVAGWRMPFFSS